MGRSQMRRRRVTGVAMCALAGLAACTSGGNSTPETTIAATTTTLEPPTSQETDGVLTIGLLLPMSEQALGPGLIDAALEAVDRINAAGGVLGEPVRIVREDEGLGDGTAATSITALLDADSAVDAIIGPSSSITALDELDTIVATGRVACSPTATALALDDFPDNRLFFRTVPSDSLQAVAIADLAEQTGVRNVAVVYIDDAYGRPFGAAVQEALDDGTRSVDDVTRYPFVRTDGDLQAKAQAVADSGASVVVLLAAAEDGVAFLEALDDTSFGSISNIFVNDALRAPAITQRIEALDPALRNMITGLAPQAQSSDQSEPFDPPGLFASHAFDCVNLIALAAQSVGSDDPALFASQIAALTVVGRTCTSFRTCDELLDLNLNVDYDGPDGITELLVVGDPARSRFDVFEFDETGRADSSRSIVASF